MSRTSLAELLLSDLLQVEHEALEEENFPLSDGEPEDIRVDLERAAGSGPLLAPRERKAGCKNFFWKTFTSCWEPPAPPAVQKHETVVISLDEVFWFLWADSFRM